MSDYLLSICLPTTCPFLIDDSLEQSLSILQPTKRQCLCSTIQVFAVSKVPATVSTTVCLGDMRFQITSFIQTAPLCSGCKVQPQHEFPLSVITTLFSSGTLLILLIRFAYHRKVVGTSPLTGYLNWAKTASALDPYDKCRWLLQQHYCAVECRKLENICKFQQHGCSEAESISLQIPAPLLYFLFRRRRRLTSPLLYLFFLGKYSVPWTKLQHAVEDVYVHFRP